jgi:hypothetical protein
MRPENHGVKPETKPYNIVSMRIWVVLASVLGTGFLLFVPLPIKLSAVK